MGLYISHIAYAIYIIHVVTFSPAAAVEPSHFSGYVLGVYLPDMSMATKEGKRDNIVGRNTVLGDSSIL